MNLAELENKVLQLPEEERRKFASWFYDHEDEIAGPAPADDDLSDTQKVELTRRFREIEQHPEMLVPFEEADVKPMFAEFAHARSQAPSARQG